MKNILIALAVSGAIALSASPAFLQETSQPKHEHGMGQGMMQGGMMCPMMGSGNMGMMGGGSGSMMGGMSGMMGGMSSDPKMMGRMMQMRGEMMMKMGEVMMKYGKQIQAQDQQ